MFSILLKATRSNLNVNSNLCFELPSFLSDKIKSSVHVIFYAPLIII